MKSTPRAETAVLLTMAALIAAMHILTNGRYGFHRDELQVLSDARHLEWGFVAYPPLDPFLARIGLSVFGLSLAGLRLFSVTAQFLAIVFTGLMAFELGGGRMAQIAAALSVALAPLALFEGTEFQYTSYDYLWWVLIAYFVIRLLKTDDARWWLAIGAVTGLGLLTKYAIAFYIAGIMAGLLLTPARRFLASVWFWAGAGLALLIFLPNLVWQVRHDFISLHFLQSIHTRDVGEGRADHFLLDQFRVCTNLFTAPLWIGGLFVFLRDRRYRMLAWMYLVPLALLLAGRGRGYYLAAGYPMLLAMGSVAGERWISKERAGTRRWVEAVLFSGILIGGAVQCAVIIPFASEGLLRDFALSNNGDLREEIGWDDLVREVARIRDALPPDQRERAGVLVGNYGEGGAIEILGPQYHLPVPISGTNSAWYRGYPTPPRAPLIVVGLSKRDLDAAFRNCRIAGHNGNSQGVANEESKDHPDIFVCEAPRQPWAEFWKAFQHFG